MKDNQLPQAEAEHRYMRAGQLAHYLGVPPDYVSAMRFCGFPMPGGRNTPAEARKWLRKNPDFRTDAAKHTTARPALRAPPKSPATPSAGPANLVTPLVLPAPAAEPDAATSAA